MKWNNKGHQYDEAGKRWTEELNKRDGIWIFGAGIYGRELQILFSNYDDQVKFKGYIDNNVNKKNEISDCAICLFDEYIDRKSKDWIVIAAEGSHITEIEKQLEDHGKVKNKDYFEMEDFLGYYFPIISMYGYGKLYTRTSQICVTERCTLKSKKCAHGCFAVDSSAEDLSIEDVFVSADSFFRKFDYVTEFSLLGGEPLLYKKLPEAIEYIGSKYRRQIVNFTITSNGTIIPSDRLVEAMGKYHMIFRLSNYSNTIPSLSARYAKIMDVLKNGGVEYRFHKEFLWGDFGYGCVDRGNVERELINTFDQCSTGCREVRKNRYYFCVMARSSSENMNFNVGKEDYFDLEHCDDRMHLFEYNLGYSQKGYLDMCNFCNGRDFQKYPIPAAEQI